MFVWYDADIAQLAERFTCNEDVTDSTSVIGSMYADTSFGRLLNDVDVTS